MALRETTSPYSAASCDGFPLGSCSASFPCAHLLTLLAHHPHDPSPHHRSFRGYGMPPQPYPYPGDYYNMYGPPYMQPGVMEPRMDGRGRQEGRGSGANSANVCAKACAHFLPKSTASVCFAFVCSGSIPIAPLQANYAEFTAKSTAGVVSLLSALGPSLWRLASRLFCGARVLTPLRRKFLAY